MHRKLEITQKLVPRARVCGRVPPDQDVIPSVSPQSREDFMGCCAQTTFRAVSRDRVPNFLGTGIPDPDRGDTSFALCAFPRLEMQAFGALAFGS